MYISFKAFDVDGKKNELENTGEEKQTNRINHYNASYAKQPSISLFHIPFQDKLCLATKNVLLITPRS